MTYGRLKILTSALLTGDTKFVKDPNEALALLEMAYGYLVDKCQVLNLQTEDKSAMIQRLARGDMLIRKPELPIADTDELDIDEELCPAIASLLASYVSDKKIGIHQGRADDIIRSYNAKVDEFIESIPELTGEIG